PAALPWTQEHPTHGQVHRTGARPVQGLLEGLMMPGQDPSRRTEDPFEEDDAPCRRDHSSAGSRILRGMRSLGPTAVLASSITLFLGLGESSRGPRRASTDIGSIVPSIIFADAPACAASEVSMYSIMASSCSSDRFLITLLCSILCSRRISRVRHRKYTPGCSRRTFAMAFSPCLRKSRNSAQMTSSLSLLREPRSRPVGFPDCPGCQRLVGMCVLTPCCCCASV